MKRSGVFALCCNEANLLGKDWFYITITKYYPFYNEHNIGSDKERSQIRKLITSGQLVMTFSSQYGAVYELPDTNFKMKYQKNRTNVKNSHKFDSYNANKDERRKYY